MHSALYMKHLQPGNLDLPRCVCSSSCQIDFVSQAVACDRLKCAASAVRTLGLGAEFPDIEAQCKLRSVARLVLKQLWGPAAAYVGTDERLQLTLLKEVSDVFSSL